jgi:hypothetical protein
MGLAIAIYDFSEIAPAYDVVWRKVCELAGRPVQIDLRLDTLLTDDENRPLLDKQKHSRNILISGSRVTFRLSNERKLWVDLTKSLRGDQMIASGNSLPLMELVGKALTELGAVESSIARKSRM